MRQGQLHGPRKYVPCVVIRRPLGRGLSWDGTAPFPHSISPPPPDCWSTQRGAIGKWRLPLAFFYRMDQDLADCCCCCRTRFLWGKQRIVPSWTDGALSPQYRSSSNQPDSSATHWIQSLTHISLFFPHPSMFILFYSSCVNVSTRMRMFFSQNTVQAAGKRGADRQMCPNPLAYE